MTLRLDPVCRAARLEYVPLFVDAYPQFEAFVLKALECDALKEFWPKVRGSVLGG